MSVIPRSRPARKIVAALVVAGAAFGITSAVQASIPDSQGIVHSCYNTSLAHGSPTGAMRAIDTDKANGNCASWEGAVDLATPEYVQNVVTSTVNQTSFMFGFTQTLGAGGYYAWFTCGGWVGTDPNVSVNPPTVAGNQALTPHAWLNVNQDANGTPGTETRIYFDLSSTQTISAMATCVDPRVFGETYPVSAPKPQTSAGIQKVQ
jgi:hypothetical protein